MTTTSTLAGTHQHVGDFQGLFSGIRLRNQQFGHVDAQFLRVSGVQSVFGVDKCSRSTQFLHLGDHL
jgi:hypothetical protein